MASLTCARRCFEPCPCPASGWSEPAAWSWKFRKPGWRWPRSRVGWSRSRSPRSSTGIRFQRFPEVWRWCTGSCRPELRWCSRTRPFEEDGHRRVRVRRLRREIRASIREIRGLRDHLQKKLIYTWGWSKKIWNSHDKLHIVLFNCLFFIVMHIC